MALFPKKKDIENAQKNTLKEENNFDSNSSQFTATSSNNTSERDNLSVLDNGILHLTSPSGTNVYIDPNAYDPTFKVYKCAVGYHNQNSNTNNIYRRTLASLDLNLLNSDTEYQKAVMALFSRQRVESMLVDNNAITAKDEKGNSYTYIGSLEKENGKYEIVDMNKDSAATYLDYHRINNDFSNNILAQNIDKLLENHEKTRADDSDGPEL